MAHEMWRLRYVCLCSVWHDQSFYVQLLFVLFTVLKMCCSMVCKAQSGFNTSPALPEAYEVCSYYCCYHYWLRIKIEIYREKATPGHFYTFSKYSQISHGPCLHSTVPDFFFSIISLLGSRRGTQVYSKFKNAWHIQYLLEIYERRNTNLNLDF